LLGHKSLAELMLGCEVNRPPSPEQ
jgi:hypothetical protein